MKLFQIITLITFSFGLTIIETPEYANPDLENQYRIMIESQTYIDFDSAGKDFLSKINFHSDFEILDNEQKFIIWLTNNISYTKYKNITEAKVAWDEVKMKYQTSRTANDSFYVALKMSRMYDFVDLLAPEVYSSKDPCLMSCESTFKKAVSNAAITYESVLKYNVDASHPIAWLSFQNKRNICLRASNLCKKGCEAQD